MDPIIVWFRQDLRLADNPALIHAAQSGQPVVCLYILDDKTPGHWRMGGASRWWLHKSLAALSEALQDKGCKLVLRCGKAADVLNDVIKETGATSVVWNRCYEPYAVKRDTAIKKHLSDKDIDVQSFNASLLFEPWEIKTQGGTPFRVFTPFWRACLAAPSPAKPQHAPRKIEGYAKRIASDTLSDWGLLPQKPNWADGFEDEWTPGEDGAQTRFNAFVKSKADYARGRDAPSDDATSRLSPHLHFGEISPRQIWHGIHSGASHKADKFLSEIGWREFSHHLLFHNPSMPDEPLDERFTQFPWRDASADFRAWAKGQTGIPIVDAGMRQLWQTGYMHNRVRMIAASFLIKHLRIDWRRGEDWFWNTLVDADLASNAQNWQWVAGCGADAAPFFRIFNPVLQGVKFDTDGEYVRRFVPELGKLDAKFIHKPWEADAATLKSAGIELGRNYPRPLVDLKKGRDAALAAFRELSGSA